jgi:DEAD/DEAH box helicase domain-containing protein
MAKPPPAYPVPAVRPVPTSLIAEALVAELQGRPTDVFVRRIDAREARYGEWAAELDPRLVNVLRKRGIERPFVHQAKAIESALAGANTVVVTPTASGKTLCYNVPVLNTVLRDPSARAMFLFPTKALAQDQLDELHGLITDLEADIRTSPTTETRQRTRGGRCVRRDTWCSRTRTCCTRPSFRITPNG